MLNDLALKELYKDLLPDEPGQTDASAYLKDSPVQPASLDLRVGDIYVPGVERDKNGGLDKPKDSHILDAGQTAVIFTKETLNVPDNLGAIGFPPTNISDKGILMTNPGHVDPGFSGKLSFTVINMGQEPFPVRRGDIIVTLVFFRLPGPAYRSYNQRNPSPEPGEKHDLNEDRLGRLAPDMLNIDCRVRKIIKSEENKTRLVAVVVPVFLAAVVALGTIFGPALSNWRTHFEDVKSLQVRVDELEQKVKDLQSTLTTEVPRVPTR
jgi:deoxycytidine triphosphate deaminase